MKDIYKYVISVVFVFMVSVTYAFAEVKREYQICDENGFEWYLLTDTQTGKKGAADKRGNILIPTEYTRILYDSSIMGHPDDSTLGYFMVKDAQGTMALYAQNGNCILPKGKYDYAWLEYFRRDSQPYVYMRIGSNDLDGIADLYGKAVIVPKYGGFVGINKSLYYEDYGKQLYYIEAEGESNKDIYDLSGNLILSLNKEEVSFVSLSGVYEHPEKPYFKVELENNKTAFYDVKGNHLITVNERYANIYQREDGSFWYDSYRDNLDLNFMNTDLTPFMPTKRYHISRLEDGSSSDYYSSNHSQTSSAHTSNERSTGGGRQPLATGTYTISQQGQSVTSGSYTGVAGPDQVVTIEFFDDGITVGGLWCEYAGESNGRKKYNYPISFGGSSTAYYVDSNYNVQKQSTFSSPYGTDWFNYRVVKGNVSIPKNQPYNGGDYSNGSYSSPGSYSNSSSNSGSSNTYEASCPHCHGSGKCNTCNGTHRYLNPLTNKYVVCPNCRPDGACSHCGGTGKKH